MEEEERIFTHIRVTIHPDGGIKRVRAYGKRAYAREGEALSPTTIDKPMALVNEINGVNLEKPLSLIGKAVPALMLTPEAFAPYGNVVQAYNTAEAAPRGVKVTGANQGSAIEYHALAAVKSCYPIDCNAKAALSVYRAKPIDAAIGELFDVHLLERHPCTNQAFFALGAGTGVSEYALEKQGRAYLVIVALNGEGMSTSYPEFWANA
jgi:allantoicase